MSIKLDDVAAWLCRELPGAGFARSDKKAFAVVDAVKPIPGPAVIVRFGNEAIRLEIHRENGGPA